MKGMNEETRRLAVSARDFVFSVDKADKSERMVQKYTSSEAASSSPT